MTGLLVSVRNAQEARLALAGGADLIDVKEPARGALGAADPAIWAEVLAVTAGAVPTSAALGEISQVGELPDSSELAKFQFAKWGLARCQRYAEWRQQWSERLERLPHGPVPVAVVYADWQRAEAPPPENVIENAPALGCGAVLFDTYDKTHGRLLDALSLSELARLTSQVRQTGLPVVLGGGLCPATIPQILTLEPDYVAVRGAACRSGRTGDLDVTRVRELRVSLRRVA